MTNIVGSMVRAVKRLHPLCLLMLIVDNDCVVVVLHICNYLLVPVLLSGPLPILNIVDLKNYQWRAATDVNYLHIGFGFVLCILVLIVVLVQY